MPWEKSFNVEQAIDSAKLQFWKNGYSDSPMSDLLKVTGLTKGSFYNAFGSKRNLFIRTFKKYDRESQAFLHQLIAMDSPKEAIRTFFDGLVETTIYDQDKKGCFTVNMLICIKSYDEEIQNLVRGSVLSVETFLKQMVELGQTRGEIPADLVPEMAAKFLVGAMVSIRVLGRGTYDPKEVRELADQAFSIVQKD
ncbi:TetR/AcrR family transcriptional regulator [Rubellicoccus peritrichatus]|uniref:TetR/AcrR family transcriptional regulator n=1 Tax=Rubellicoccus peritrichatus TaxID=3080537 RepID=A0AAQ3QSD5_9BACT|nr:TetR/AcrR family transcriptional regulator [Puniceicoccus sp. CR14]WOO40246.1 TetR/AcrR family transcriptional regulator [Puniceicoccus sp. CR14]